MSAGEIVTQLDTVEERARCIDQANRCLVLLMESDWLTNDELSAAGFLRYGATIEYLRNRGHQILTEHVIGGTWRYRYVGSVETAKVTESWKARYYASAHWRTKRLVRLEMDGHACCWCKATTELHVHHWRYELFDEDVADLMTLCRLCHEKIHNYKGVRISFPKSLPVPLCEKIDEPPEPEQRHVGEPDSDPPPFGMLFAVDEDEPRGYYDE